jgi:hypothetical protein
MENEVIGYNNVLLQLTANDEQMDRRGDALSYLSRV